MISVICPSRERADLLEKSLGSLGKGHELLVRVDNDDPQLEQYRRIPGIKLTVGERLGYERLNEYINELSTLSTGDWLFLWNDDAVMETPDWETFITQDPTKPAVLNPHIPLHNYFPLISRPFYEALGHYSVSPNSDSYVAEIARELGIEYYIEEIEINHLRGSLNDPTEENSLRVAPMMSPVHEAHRYSSIPEAVKKIRSVM